LGNVVLIVCGFAGLGGKVVTVRKAT